MDYRVIGSNGHEYGPVSAEQVRAWLADGRLNVRTLVRGESSPDWKPLSQWPEFQASVAPAALPAAAGPPMIRQTNALAIWGLICGLLSFFCCSCCCVPFDLVGIVLCVMAMVQINANPGTQTGMPIAVTGLVLCLLSVVGGVVLSGVWLLGGGEQFLNSMQ